MNLCSRSKLVFYNHDLRKLPTSGTLQYNVHFPKYFVFFVYVSKTQEGKLSLLNYLAKNGDEYSIVVRLVFIIILDKFCHY